MKLSFHNAKCGTLLQNEKETKNKRGKINHRWVTSWLQIDNYIFKKPKGMGCFNR